MSVLSNLLGGGGNCGCDSKASFRQGEKILTSVNQAEQNITAAVESTDLNLMKLGYETNIRDNTYQCQTLGNVQFGNEIASINHQQTLAAIQSATDNSFLKSQALLLDRDNANLRDSVSVLRDEVNQLKALGAVNTMLCTQTGQLTAAIQNASAQNAQVITCDSNRNFAALNCNLDNKAQAIAADINALGCRLQPYPQVQCVAVTPCCGSGTIPASFNQIVPTSSCGCSNV